MTDKTRLSNIVTKTGDDGTTGLAGSAGRVSKCSARIEAIGTIDELNCFVGMLLCKIKDDNILSIFGSIQNDLFDLGGELAMPGFIIMQPDHYEQLERHIESLNLELPPLENFILPGGTEQLSAMHIVRTVARRAERRLVALDRFDDVNNASLIYLNRLSDLAFVSARHLSWHHGDIETLWQQSTERPQKNGK